MSEVEQGLARERKRDERGGQAGDKDRVDEIRPDHTQQVREPHHTLEHPGDHVQEPATASPYGRGENRRVLRTWKGVHPYRDAEPSQKDKHDRCVGDVETKRDGRSEADRRTQQRIDDERADRDEEARAQTLGGAVHHVAGRIANSKVADLVDRNFRQIAEESVRGLVDDYSWKGQDCDDDQAQPGRSGGDRRD
jgi:hypothetical protein